MGLFEQELQVLNVGLASFADEIVQAGGKATRIEWTPPAGGDCAAGMALARLVNDAAVEAANRRAFAAYPERRTGARGNWARPRRHFRHERAAHPSRRATDRVEPHVRPDARSNRWCDSR